MLITTRVCINAVVVEIELEKIFMNRVDQKVALVTGGGSGIGRASCELLAEAGAWVVVSDINVAAAEETAKLIIESGGEAIAMQLDVSSEADWQKAMAFTFENYKKLDVLVNNAGIHKSVECKDMSLEDWRRMMSVNLDAVFLGIRSAINMMIGNKQMGSIINIASVDSLRAFEMNGAYSASKAGVKMLAKTAALECGKKGYNIRVNSILPGGVKTQMAQSLFDKEALEAKGKAHPIGRMAEPIDIARAVLFLASDDSSFMTGSDFIIDGGATAGL